MRRAYLKRVCPIGAYATHGKIYKVEIEGNFFRYTRDNGDTTTIGLEFIDNTFWKEVQPKVLIGGKIL